MIHILCISDAHKQFTTAVDEYTKRLNKTVTLTLLKPSRKDDPSSKVKEETTLIKEKLIKLPKPRILLEKDGMQYTSEQFATLLENYQQTATYIIGGTHGVAVDLLQADIHSVLSRGKQTMPHGLALVVLLEQLWRAQCIRQGKTYHY